MSPPTICQVLHGLSVGGAEVLATRMAHVLSDDFRFVFVCLDELGVLGQGLREKGFTVELLGRRSGLDLRCALRLSAYFQREQVDLVHAHQYTPFFYSLLARLKARRLAILVTEHGRPHPDFPRHKRIAANRLLIERRDRVVAVGQAVRQALILNEGISANRIEVVYNGIDLLPFGGAEKDRDDVRHELGVGHEEMVVIMVARLDPMKDHITAIRTMTSVIRNRSDFKLFLVGEGLEESAIRDRIGQAGLESHVRMLGLSTDVPHLLAAADVALLTSVSEGIPLTLIEAMGARLPVVSTDVGGVGEVVEDGSSGLLAPSGDHEALAGHLLRLAADPSLRSRMGQLGYNRAHAVFSERMMHDHYRKLYLEMLPGRRG